MEKSHHALTNLLEESTCAPVLRFRVTVCIHAVILSCCMAVHCYTAVSTLFCCLAVLMLAKPSYSLSAYIASFSKVFVIIYLRQLG